MAEKLIIQKILNGDSLAYKYFVDKYHNMAFSIAYNICYNREDAEDIVQDAFMNAYLNLKTFNIISKFSSWLYRIVYNLSISHINSPRKKIFILNYDETFQHKTKSTDEIFETNERQTIIYELLKKMDPDERLILTLYYINEYKVKDIINITGYSESKIKVQLHRARKKLSEMTFEVFEYKAS